MKTKEKKVQKYIRPKNSQELIHHWANHLSPIDKEIKINGYEVYRTDNESELYKNGYLIGLYNNRLNSFFVKKEITSSSWGSGYTTHYILNAISNENKFAVKKLPEIDRFKISYYSYYEWFKNEFLDYFESSLNQVSYIKEYVKNNKITSRLWTDNYRLERKDEFLKPFQLISKRHYNKVIKEVIKYNSKCKKYEGWSYTYTYYNIVPLEFKIKDYLEKGNNLFLTEEEQKVIEFKNWRHKYIKRDGRFIYNLEVSKDIFNNEERKKEAEESLRIHEEFKKSREETRRAEERKKDLKRHIETFKNIDLWREDRYRNFNFGYYDVLRIINYGHYNINNVNNANWIAEKMVETSRRARFTLEEAKMLYKLFKRCIETDIEFIPEKEILVSGYKLISIVKRPMTVINIEKEEEETVNTWVIRVACHSCIASEVEAFIKYYKLDW